MNLTSPLLGALFQAGGFILDKRILLLRRITFQTYTSLSFPLYFLIVLGAFFIAAPPFSLELLWASIGLLALSLSLNIIGNIVFYRALARDTLGEIQIIDLVSNIPIIIVSSFLFADERNTLVLVLALGAAFAVIWAHWHRRHFTILVTTLPLLLWSLVAPPIEAAITKTLLAAWHPVSLELVRSGVLAIFFASIFSRSIQNVHAKAFSLLILTNLFWACGWILFYMSYQEIGVVYTSLIFLAEPLMVYMGSLLVLKERLDRKKVLAFFLVLASITLAHIFG